MRVYTYLEARQKLALVLKQVQKEGAVRIRRKDGRCFVIRPEPSTSGSPLDVEGVDLDVTTEEILGFIRESRRDNPL